MHKFNESLSFDFAGKTAAKRYLQPVGLSEQFIPFNYAAIPISFDKEQEFFKALHYVKYRLKKSIKENYKVKFWNKLYTVLRNKVIASYMPLIHDCISKTSIRIDDYDEMVSIGSEALISAAEAFDPWRGFKFSTYACKSILHRYSSTARRNKNPQGCIDVSEIDVALPEEDPDIELYKERIKLALENAGLTEREKGILKMRFDDKKQTLGDVSQVFGLSKERVRQIQVVALNKLREYLKEDTALQ